MILVDRMSETEMRYSWRMVIVRQSNSTEIDT